MKQHGDRILLAHGGGGKLSRDLIEKEITARLYRDEERTRDLPDAAGIDLPDTDIVFTTDSFVVTPAFFPGGNIGELSIYGTVNDIAVSGAVPRFISLALILEEGYPLADLRKVLDSARAAADRCEVRIVTGDTKVVAAGQCDGIYINTAGIGTRIPGFDLSADRITKGDAVVVSGTIAEHGLAVMCARSGIALGHGPKSDSGPVHALVKAATDLGAEIRFMRDPTRGGLSSVLNEIVAGKPTGILLHESKLPLSPAARSASEILGLDPLHVASEGRVVAVCSHEVADDLVSLWAAVPEGSGSTRIGTVTGHAGIVSMETATGGIRMVDVPRGELLPRIC